MSDMPKYPAIKPPEVNETVAKSVAKPNAFAKPGTPSTRFRPMTAKRAPGRQRKRKPDPRRVHFF